MIDARDHRAESAHVGHRALNRRQLLATSAAAGVATAVSSASSAAAAEESVDVAIVGAGISGMVAARELLKAGRTVVILEANNRTGGRILNGKIAGAVCELGAEWLGPNQPHMTDLYKEFGLETFPTFLEGATTFVNNGEVTPFTDTPPPLPQEDLLELRAAIQTITEMGNQILLDAPWTAPEALAWDSQTLEEWLAANIYTDGARNSLTTVMAGSLSAPASQSSLLHALFMMASGSGIKNRATGPHGGILGFRTVGGTGMLVEKLTEELGDHIRLNAPVRLIDQSGEPIRITYEGGAVTADDVIVSIPPAMAGRITYEPPLPALRDLLTQNAPMGWTRKCFAAYETPFWRDAGLNGFVNDITPDAILEGVFDNSPPSGKPGILFGWMAGESAREWAGHPAEERKAAVLAAYASFFGDQALSPIDYVEHSWNDEPWVRGCSAAVFGPGFWTQYGPVLHGPQGRIYWTGTEMSYHQWSCMDGAVESAFRAVKAILG